MPTLQSWPKLIGKKVASKANVMKYLFVFAHPDDETVACAGTLHKLVEAGEDVLVVSVTDGGAGEVNEQAQARLAKLSSVNELRKLELQEALDVLGVKHAQVLDFQDGQITNQMTWGSLRSALIDVVDAYKPDVVITFDHSGWYFHLDHVATSIATTWAVQQAKFPPQIFLLVHFRVQNSKWKYIFSDKIPATHTVDVSDVKEIKMTALEHHVSQDLTEPKRQLREEPKSLEYYQLASATPAGKKLLKKHWLFQPIRWRPDELQDDSAS